MQIKGDHGHGSEGSHCRAGGRRRPGHQFDGSIWRAALDRAQLTPHAVAAAIGAHVRTLHYWQSGGCANPRGALLVAAVHRVNLALADLGRPPVYVRDLYVSTGQAVN